MKIIIVVILKMFFYLAIVFCTSGCDENFGLGKQPPPGWKYWWNYPDSRDAPFQPYDICLGNHQGIWVACSLGIFFYNDSSWIFYDSIRTLKKLPLGPYHAIHVAPDSTVWAGGEYGILAAFSNGQWTTFSDFQAQLPLATVSVLSTQPNTNKLWVGTDGYGVATLYNGSWTYYSRYWTPELVNNIINDLVVDRTNVVWIATDSGITRVDGAEWRNYSRENTGGGIPDNRITALGVDSLNNLWAGTYRGYLLKYDGRVWLSYVPDSANGKLPGLPILGLAIDNANNKWIGFEWSKWRDSQGNREGGVMKFNDIEWKRYTPSTTIYAMPGGEVFDVVIDYRNHKWFAIAGGVTRYSKE